VLANTSRVIEHLDRCGLDALVLALPVSVAYATEHQSSFETTYRGRMLFPGGGEERFFRSFAVVAANGDRALVSHAALAVDSFDWDGVFELYGGGGFDPEVTGGLGAALRPLADRLQARTADRGPMAALAAAISTVAPGAHRIGVERDGLGPSDASSLGDFLGSGTELLDASVLVRVIRMVKTSDEVERSTTAAEIGEVALRALVDAAEPGIDLAALCDRFRLVAAERGAEYDHVALGPRGLGIALRRHVLEGDEVAMLDVGCRVRGAVSDTGVTIALGGVSSREEDEYAALLAAVEAGRERLLPGESVVDIYRAMRAVVDGSPASASLPQGHGLGLEPKELPFIAAVEGQRFADECVDLDADIGLEEGMVINLEVPLEVPGSRSFQIEQTFLITATGAEPITAQPRERIVAAGSTADLAAGS
jgi:Xaa-Pro dipeptidase